MAEPANAAVKGPVSTRPSALSDESGGGVGDDDHQRGSDGDTHLDSQQQNQCGDDQEATADAEQSGKDTDAESGRYGPEVRIGAS